MRRKTNENELRKLSRVDLLEILVEQETEIERLKAELEEAQEQLRERQLKIEQTGSIAEASIVINGVFEAAQQAAEQYLENVKRSEEEQIMKTARYCAAKKEQAEKKIRKALMLTARYCQRKKEQAENEEKKG